MELPFTAPDSSRSSSGITSPGTRHSRSRTQSISSDRPSTITHGLMSPPISVTPEAAFIAASAASQIVTNDHDSHADRWFDEHGMEPSGETVLVSPSALQLVNNFLDQLLFSFLYAAKSTSLSALRPAVSEVLKPKLAKDAVNLADEELREYLGSSDEEYILQATSDPGSDWDVELIWKRTRLRCMVYSSLGDMEEEDEDYYMEQEQLEDSGRPSDVVSPAVAIFMTSILEFMGEQALIVAGQAAYHRVRTRHEKELKDGLRGPADVSDRIIVEDLDMERVALDRTLGRLWRAWKKRIRSPTLENGGLQRAFSRNSLRSTNHFRQENTLFTEYEPLAPAAEIPEETKTKPGDVTLEDCTEAWVRAAEIPLPMGERDIDEIEVPGLAEVHSDEEEDDDFEQVEKPRPTSLIIFPTANKTLPITTMTQPVSQVVQSRKRSNSLPSPATLPFNFLMKCSKVEQQIFTQLEIPKIVGDEAPISTEEISPKAQPEDESPEEPAAASAENESELDSNVTPVPKKSARRPAGRPIAPDDVAEKQNYTTPAVAMLAEREKTKDQEPTIEGEIKDFSEEPEVLNFSRVAVAGRTSPTGPADSALVSGKPLPINTAIPVRTPSIQSARLVEVTTPRSTRPHQGSASLERRHSHDKQNQHHAAVVVLPPASIANSRASSIMTRTNNYSSQPSITEEPSGVGAPEHHSRPHQQAEQAASPATQAAILSPLSREVVASVATPERSSSRQRRAPDMTPATATVPAASQSPPVQHPLPSEKSVSPLTPAPKVTILNSTHGTFLDMDDHSEAPVKPVVIPSIPYPRREMRETLPSVPEQSINRPPPTSGSSQNIGRPSVEWSVYGRESPEEPSPDSRTGSRGRVHALENSPSSPASSKYKPMRTSNESASEPLPGNFEDLLNGDKPPLKYTLTPEGVRDPDTKSITNGSPVMSIKVRKSEDRPSATRSRSSSDNRSVELKRTGSVTRTAPPAYPIAELRGPVPRAPPTQPGISRGGPQPRDARTARESMADFAKWIRDSGPSGFAEFSLSMSGAAGGLHNGSGVGNSMSKASLDTPVRGGTSSSAGSNSTTRPKLQARDATVSSHDETSDLIDFIRRGPPSTNPRIPRAVAPFRSTMDSDQMTAAIGGKAVDANLSEIRYSGGTAQTEPSIHSSVDSRSALLVSGSKPGRSNGGYGAAHGIDDDSSMPKRTRRGPRDPYAIEMSDDESDADLFDRPLPKKEAKEESLAEFLMNYEPPQTRNTSPPVTLPSNKPKKKSSAPSLMARFTRSHHVPLSKSIIQSPTSNRNDTDRSSISSRATSGGARYVPIQVNMPFGSETYGNGPVSSSGYSASLSTQSGPAHVGGTVASAARVSGSSRIPMKKFEPREAINVTSRTNDLADFFKNSGPPGGAVSSAPALGGGVSSLSSDGRPSRRRMKF